MSSDGERITSLTGERAKIENARLQRQGLIAKIRGMQQRHRLARRLFAQRDGTLTIDGIAFFQLLADMAGMGVTRQRATDREDTWAAAQRALALKIMDLVHIDEVQLMRLSRLAEGESDD